MQNQPNLKTLANNNIPEIIFFRSDADSYMVGDTALLEWDVKNARTVSLDGVQIRANSTEILVTGALTFELIAINRRGRVSEFLQVRLFAPVVLRFDSSVQIISESEPVALSLQLKHATNWKITAQYGFPFNGKTEVVGAGATSNGKAIFEHTIEVILKGACTLLLTASNGHEQSAPVTTRVDIKRLSVNLYTDGSIVGAGAKVKLTWKAENATGLRLFPGDIDVAQLTGYEFIAEGNRDITIELKGKGDFNQEASSTATIYLARINEVYTSNNGDPAKPEFYLNWSSTGLGNMRLLPENVPVRDSETNFRIPESTLPVTYTLIGQTFNAEEVVAVINLNPATLNEFRLAKGRAIIGQLATAKWLAMDAKRIQLNVSDRPGWNDLNVKDTASDFQVFESTSHINIAVWGDTNMLKSTVSVPRFVSPEINSMVIPRIDIQLGIKWIPSPLAAEALKTKHLYKILEDIPKVHGLFFRVLNFISNPSGKLIHQARYLAAIYLKSERNASQFRSGATAGVGHAVNRYKKIKEAIIHSYEQANK